jgi:alpha-L-rhamnosidase
MKSDQSILVSYNGSELKPAETYFWKAKVWNQDNQESEWSEINVFRTGLLNNTDWKDAKLIGFKYLPAGK